MHIELSIVLSVSQDHFEHPRQYNLMKTDIPVEDYLKETENSDMRFCLQLPLVSRSRWGCLTMCPQPEFSSLSSGNSSTWGYLRGSKRDEIELLVEEEMIHYHRVC